MANWFCASDKWTAVTAWAALTVYAVGDLRRQLAAPTAGNERVFRCTTAGTSGAAEPTWTLTVGSTTNDGTAVWTEVTGSSTYNATDSWLAPHASLQAACATGWVAAGDTLYVGSNHAHSRAAAITVACAGTLAAPCKIYCVDDTNATPTLATTATETTTGTAAYTLTGHFTMYGITFSVGTGAGSSSWNSGNSAGNVQRYESCTVRLAGTGTSARIAIGATAGQAPSEITMVNFSFKFANAAQGITLTHSRFRSYGGQLESGGTSPTSVFYADGSNRAGDHMIFGLNLVNASAGVHLAGVATAASLVRFVGFKLPASWSGDVYNGTPIAGARYEMYLCAAGDTNYALKIKDYCGTIDAETTIVVTGGSSDGTTPFSLVMTTNANAEYPIHVLRSPQIFKREETTGGALTATVEAIHSGIGGGTAGALLDSEAWIQLLSLTTSGFPLLGFVDDRVGLLTTPADQPAGGATWTSSPATPVKNKFVSPSFTPQEKGDVIAEVCLAKPSVTMYMNVDLDGIGASTKAVYMIPGFGYRAETAGTSGGGGNANILRGSVVA